MGTPFNINQGCPVFGVHEGREGVLVNALHPYKKVTGATAATYADEVIGCVAGAAYTVTLPGAAPIGKIYAVIKDDGAHIVTVTPSSGLIEGESSVTLAADARHGILVISNGTDYQLLAAY